jgi:hypothetical protein
LDRQFDNEKLCLTGLFIFTPIIESLLQGAREREFLVHHNLLVRIYVIIEIILVDRPCAIGV